MIGKNEDKVKSCPQCNNGVEKDEGCNHITCRCGSHWCWKCVTILDPNNLPQHFTEKHPIFDYGDK